MAQKLSQARGICNITSEHAAFVRPRARAAVCNQRDTLYERTFYTMQLAHTRALAVYVMWTKTTRDECAYAKAQGSAASARDFLAHGRMYVHMKLW